MTVRGISLFTGAGGMDRGFEEAGVEVVAACEMDAWACETFRANFPGVELHAGRIETVEWERYAGAVDVVFGGPPCQPFSAAGRGAGRYDPRDGMPWFIDVVRRVRPRAFVIENVAGLTFEKHAPYLGKVLGDLKALGYALEHRVLDAADHGVPQRRHRLFVVGRLVGEGLGSIGVGVPGLRWPEATHADPGLLVADGLFPDPRRPWVTVRQALGLKVQHRENRTHPDGRPPTSWDFDGRPTTAVTVVPYMDVPADQSPLDGPSPTVMSSVNPEGRDGNPLADRRTRDDLARAIDGQPIEGRYMKISRGAPSTSNMPYYPTDGPSVPVTSSVPPSIFDDPAVGEYAGEHPKDGYRAAADPDQVPFDLLGEEELGTDEDHLGVYRREGVEPVDPDGPASTVRPNGTGGARWGDLVVRDPAHANNWNGQRPIDQPAPTVSASGELVLRDATPLDEPGPSVTTSHNDLLVRRRARVEGQFEEVDVDAPANTMRASSMDRGWGSLQLRDGPPPQSQRVMDPDRPAAAIDTRFRPRGGGAQGPMVRDEDPKHPASRPDGPAMTISAGGDGHSNHDHLLELEDLPACVCGHEADGHDYPERFIGPPTDPGCGECECQEYRPAALAQPNGWNLADPVDLDAPARTVQEHMGKDKPDMTGPVERKAARRRILEGPSPTVSAGGDRGGRGVIARGSRDELYDAVAEARVSLPMSQRVMDPDEPAPAVNSGGEGVESKRGFAAPRVPGDDHKGKRGYYRRLTPQECAKLQAFPEGFVFKGPKSAVYRQVGNAVPPPLARAVGTAVVQALTGGDT